MAKLYWPSKQTFKYEFNHELDLEIPLIENKKLKGMDKKDKDKNDNDRDM